MTPRAQRPVSVLAWVLLGLSVVLLFLSSLHRFFDHDEFEAMHTTWKLSQGQAIYTDFLQHHHPFTHYTLLPLYTLFGATTEVLIAARVVIFALLVAMLTLIYFITWEVYQDRLSAVLGTLFLSLTTLFTAKAIEIRPDVPQCLLGLLGVYLIIRFFRTRALWLLVAGGLVLGVSILYLQKGIVFTGLVGLVLLGRWLFGRDIKFSEGLIFAGSVILGVLPYLFYLLVSGGLQTYIFWNFTYNTLYYQLRGWEASKLATNIDRLFSANSVILLFFAVTVFLRRKKRLEWELLFLAAGVFGFTLLTGRQNLQYYLLVFPFVAVLAAGGFTEMLKGRVRFAVLALSFIAFMPLVTQVKNIFLSPNATQLRKIQYVLELTDPDDYVYDGNIMFNLFRQDVDFIWYMAGEPYKAAETLAVLKDYDYNVYRDIAQYKPKVISTFGIDHMDDPRIAKHYTQSPKYDDLYIRKPEQTSSAGG